MTLTGTRSQVAVFEPALDNLFTRRVGELLRAENVSRIKWGMEVSD